MVWVSFDNSMPLCVSSTFSEASYYRARYYDPSLGRFLSEDIAGFAAGIEFYAYVQNRPTQFTDPSGLYTQEPDVPPLNPRLDKFMKCMDACTSSAFPSIKEQHVTATTNGRHHDPGHAAGTTVDLRPIGTPSKVIFCCAGRCGAPYGLDERKIKTGLGKGLHYHIQLVYPNYPGVDINQYLKKYPDSIPKTPECQPGGCK
jgi:hypothetical protein